ncbi:NAD-dependent epimerase/dehydratase family protein [Roseateles sp.]|uniref:NAD-dependent epimerase/dehydratase family protein n=1 Tax=Roseateles sp. TaxID=1971397 RepID=UPI003BA7C0E2
MRVLSLLSGRWQVMALTSSLHRMPELRAAGAIPMLANLDHARTLSRLSGWADAVLHLAPPKAEGQTDSRTRHLLQTLARAKLPRRIVYASTTGVYGDCQGARFDETRPVAPTSERARRRVDAESQLRRFAVAHAVGVTILRVPGIYASNRVGGHPRERLARSAPVLNRADDVFTNHIHAADLARACLLALHRGPASRVIHVCDDSELLMGDYFDLAADLCGLARPPRINRQEAQALMTPMQLSFMSESRRLINQRLKHELRLRLLYPRPETGLLA